MMNRTSSALDKPLMSRLLNNVGQNLDHQPRSRQSIRNSQKIDQKMSQKKPDCPLPSFIPFRVDQSVPDGLPAMPSGFNARRRALPLIVPRRWAASWTAAADDSVSHARPPRNRRSVRPRRFCARPGNLPHRFGQADQRGLKLGQTVRWRLPARRAVMSAPFSRMSRCCSAMAVSIASSAAPRLREGGFALDSE